MAETRRGQRNDVVVDTAAGVVRRYPRTTRAWAERALSVARVRAAGAAGLPAPEVIEVVDGPLGSAHVVLSFVDGVGLSPEVTAQLDTPGRDRLVVDLLALLEALSGAGTSEWPGDPVPWTDRWADLGERLRRDVVPLIADGPGAAHASRQIAAAIAAAAEAGTRGLTHGDLGGENVHLDPFSGAVLGVLDWDGAAPGDPAVDLAALLAHAEPWLAAALLAADPSLQAMCVRAEAYIGTFALQQALWGLESGDEASVADGLAAYRSESSSPTDTSSTS